MIYRTLLISLLFFSCSGKPDINQVPDEPANLLNQEKFTEVMLDVQLLEASLKLKLIRDKNIQKKIPGFYDQIWEKQSITEDSFRNSLDFYGAQASKLAEIYDSVQVRLDRLKKTLDLNPVTSSEKEIPERKR